MMERRELWGSINKTIFVAAILVLLAGSGTAVAGEDPPTVGPDVVVFDLYETHYYGPTPSSPDDIVAYSVGTESCNRGTEPVEWQSGSSNEHPVIAQNVYRLKDDRLEQVGQSWLKHGFLSVNGSACDSCDHPGTSALLGVGCSDPYGWSLNGSQSSLGPRSEVNAFTGVFPIPHGNPDNGAYTTISGRAQVISGDMDPALNPGALYFVEGQYVTQDDAAAGNSFNNASYQKVTVSSDLTLNNLGDTVEKDPAIKAWSVEDPTVTVDQLRVPGEGLFFMANTARDNGDGTWRYEYAVFNLDSHRSAGSFAVPINVDTVITNAGFHDVDSHSGEPYSLTDWTIDVDNVGGYVTWSTDAFVGDANGDGGNANAIRWGTMYNFWFDADSPPLESSAQIGLWRPGSPSAIDGVVVAPRAEGASFIFADGFENGDTIAWN